MFNFTKPFERNRLVVRKRIRCQRSISTIICIFTIAYEDYIIYSYVCVVYRRYYVAPSHISYFPHLSTKPFTKPFNAKLHCLQHCYFLNFLPRLIFLYFSANSYRNIDYYCTQTQNVIKTKSTTLLNFEYFEKPICNFF